MAKAVNETFDTFKQYIMPLFAAKFAPKHTAYITLNAFELYGDQMLMQYAYTPEREQFLISQTLFFMKNCLSSEKSHNISPDFLGKLANKIAEYFSYYIMNKHPIPETGKSRNKLRLRVQAEIKAALFDNNPYIAQLKEKQAQKQKLRSKPKSARKKIAKAERRDNAREAYNSMREIRSLFAEAQCTPRKRR